MHSRVECIPPHTHTQAATLRYAVKHTHTMWVGTQSGDFETKGPHKSPSMQELSLHRDEKENITIWRKREREKERRYSLYQPSVKSHRPRSRQSRSSSESVIPFCSHRRENQLFSRRNSLSGSVQVLHLWHVINYHKNNLDFSLLVMQRKSLGYSKALQMGVNEASLNFQIQKCRYACKHEFSVRNRLLTFSVYKDLILYFFSIMQCH